ncbi:MAG: uroporphyrinogen decarboxylase family protein [Pirellulales bacterium]|nr:uroporphyrinogen decarboxylase family protein [Pirellulales bacterium]
MNSVERISATLQGKPTDRRAVSLVLCRYGAHLTGCPLSEYYTDPAAYAQGQSAVRETFEPDVLFGPFALPLEGAAFGSQVRFFDNAPPNLACPAITSVEEMDRLVVPDVDNDPSLFFIRESIRQISTQHGSEAPVAGIVLGPAELPAMILGIEGWMEALLFDEVGTRRMFDMTIGHFVRWANALLHDGASFLAVPIAFSNPSVVTRETAVKWTVPAIRKALAQVMGPVMIHSAGARIMPFLDLFVGLPNVVGFVLHSGESFAEARRIVGHEPLLLGNIDGPGLFLRTREEIQAECLAILNDRRDDPRFVLGTSAADIDARTPPENIRAFHETVEAFAEKYVA